MTHLGQFEVVIMRIRAKSTIMNMFLFLAFLFPIFAQNQVDNLNILLPQLTSSPPQNPLQLVTAQGGCFTWTSSSEKIVVRAHEGTGDCSKQAIIQIAEVGPYQSSIYVSATESSTLANLNIPVRIRKLAKIQIMTKSRMMNIKEIQKLQILGHDSDDNTFTSLEGLRFVWTLSQNNKIVQTVPISKAQLYIPLKVRENYEEMGFETDILIVRALAPGNLKITAKCIEPGYEHLQNEITLSVHERFELNPGPILKVIPGAKFQLELIRPTRQIIALPQSYYQITACSGFSINSTLFLTAPKESKKCTLIVEDTRTKPPYESKIDIIVQSPDDLKIASNKIAIVGKISPLKVTLLKNNITLLGDSSDLEVISDFELVSDRNAILPQRKMVGNVKARFHSLEKSITVTSLLPVQIILHTNVLHLPIHESFKLKVVGGSGIYDFVINEPIATLSSVGIITAREIGQSEITVSDRSQPSNKAVIKLIISALMKVKSLQQTKEANRDEWSYLYVMGLNDKSQTFTQCLQSSYGLLINSLKPEIDRKIDYYQALNELKSNRSPLVVAALEPTSQLKQSVTKIAQQFKMYVEAQQISEVEVYQYIQSLENFGICEIVKFKSHLAASETVNIYVQDNQQVRTSIPIRIYQPLVTNITQEDTNFVMTPLSTLTWSYHGGSFEWPSSQTKIAVNDTVVANKQFPIVSCPNKQSYSIPYKLSIMNAQTKYLLFPAYQSTVITLTCKFPKRLQIIFDNGEYFDEINVNSKTIIKGKVQALGQHNQLYYNSSNLEFTFNALTGFLKSKQKQFVYEAKENNDKVTVFSERLKSGQKFNKIEAQFKTNIVPPIVIDHPLSSLFHNQKNMTIYVLFTPKKPYILELKNASPNIQIHCSQAISCDRSDSMIYVKYLNLGKGVLNIKDRKLYGRSEFIFNFIIVEPDVVSVVIDKQYIEEGQTANVSVNLYSDGQFIHPTHYQQSHLQLQVGHNLKIIEQQGNNFIVKSQVPETYQIYGQHSFNRAIKSAQPAQLTVYGRIQANIPNAIAVRQNNVVKIEAKTAILIGCKRILRIEGGPKNMSIQSKYESGVSVTNQKNTFSISGIKQGHFIINFLIYFQEKIICTINLDAQVSKIQSIQLNSITEPVLSAQFRVIPRIRIGQTEIDGCTCDFNYKWSVLNGKIKIGSSNSLGFLAGAGINATAIKVGSQSITLEIIEKQSQNVIGKTVKQFNILKQLNYLLPNLIESQISNSNSLLLAPNSSFNFCSQCQIELHDCSNILKSENHKIVANNIGHGTALLRQSGYRDEIISVEVGEIAQLFISHVQSSISLELESSKLIPFYLIDNHGRLFAFPLIGLTLTVTSSNPQILSAQFNPHNNTILVKSHKIGNCVLTLRHKHLFDSMAVSVGNQLNPSSFIRILKNGIVKYSLPIREESRWLSSEPEIAKIDYKTGVMRALNIGKSRISCGELTGLVYVQQISKVEQTDRPSFNLGKLIVKYKFLWQGNSKLEQLPHLFDEAAPINNNFKPYCQVSNKYIFEVATSYSKDQNGHRLVCTVQVLPGVYHAETNQLAIKILNEQGVSIASFNYSFKPSFILEKSQKHIELTSNKPKQIVTIQTADPLRVVQKNGKQQWVQTSFNSEAKTQAISIDMTGESKPQTWEVEVSSFEQVERIKIEFNKSSPPHSFFSFSLDWPDYLIIVMGAVFAGVCLLQHYHEQKIKSY